MQNLRAALTKEANVPNLKPIREATPQERVERCRQLHFDLGQEEIFAVVFTDVYSAAGHGDLAGVQAAVRSSRAKHIDDLQKGGETLLHYAVRGRRPYIIQYCLEEGADINKKNRLGWSAVHMAASGDHEDILQLLFEHGADMTAKDVVGNTAAHVAAGSGCANALRALYRCQAEDPPTLAPLTTPNMSGCYPLHQAAQFGHEEAVQFLASVGVELELLDRTKETAAHKAGRSGNLSILDILRKAGADMDALNAEGDTPMHLALDDARYG